MKGNIGLTNKIINDKINKNLIKNNFMIQLAKTESYALQDHKRYTNILPHKQIYSTQLSNDNGLFCYKFTISSNDINKFVVLKDLFLFVDTDDILVDDFYPEIVSIVHSIDGNNKQILLNDLDGESLKVINVLTKYDNKYYLQIPITSSYGIITRLENSVINIIIQSKSNYNFKLFGMFNHVENVQEVQMFYYSPHKYLNSIFTVNCLNLIKGTTSITLKDSENSLYHRSIILVTEEKDKIEGTLQTDKFTTHIDTITTPHIKLNNKIIFLITNSFNKKNEHIYNYQPQGLIVANKLQFQFTSSNECTIKIICQQYHLLTIT